MTDKQYKLPFEGYFAEVLDKMRSLAANIEQMPLKQRLEEIVRLGEGVPDCYHALRNAEARYRSEAPEYIEPDFRPELQDESLRGSEFMRRCHEYDKAHLPPEALEIHDFRNSLPLNDVNGYSADILARALAILRKNFSDEETLALSREEEALWKSNGVYIDSSAYWTKASSCATRRLDEARRKPLIGIDNLTEEQYNNGVRVIDEEFAKLRAGGSR